MSKIKLASRPLAHPHAAHEPYPGCKHICLCLKSNVHKVIITFLTTLIAVGLLTQPGESQTSQQEPAPSEASSSVIATPLPIPDVAVPPQIQPDLVPPEVPDNYKVGKDDLLSVFVYQMPELTAQVRVDESGNIHLPLMAEPIQVGGETTPQIATQIGQTLIQTGLAVNPQVRVVVRQVMSRPIVVAGAVRTPMVIQAARPMGLLEVLSRAGGLQQTAGTQVLVTTMTSEGAKTQSFPVESLLHGTAPADSTELTGGETVRVVPAHLIYAVGALTHPGAFPIQPGEPITVLRAISLAQGFSQTTPVDKKHAEIIRTDSNGRRQEIPIDLDAILKHKEQDAMLQDGDLLYVPRNGKRAVMNSILQDAGQAVVIGIGYTVF